MRGIAPGGVDAPSATTSPDSAALGAFVSDHYARLIRLATLVCHSVDEAEDAVQSGLERAWRNRGSLNDPTRLRAWLDKIVVREAIRAKGRRLTTMVSVATGAVDRHFPDEWTGLRIAFSQLSREQRAVVALHLYLGYTVAATAELIGSPTETIRSRLRLARDRLRHLLADEG
jgi:DNA-directed RNA polymerase specialized sigma24 family protein